MGLLGDTSVLGLGTVGPYLQSRGILGDGPIEAEPLGGGVSNVVIAVSDGHRRVVVKQALAKLRVADDWYASPGRAMAEAEALDVVERLTPGLAPRVLDRDPGRHVLTIERAPAGWRDWKGVLFDGAADPEVAHRLGHLLASWHCGTMDLDLPASLQETGHFEQLRLSPYYRTVAAKAPELGERLRGLAQQLSVRRTCLVHGDFSPKNVLVGDQGLWVIDLEVAHRGDPAFDVAFMLCHLVLKSVHLSAKRGEIDMCAAAFVDAYESRAGSRLGRPAEDVFSHVACLLLARVKGKSPAEYLVPVEQAQVWRLGVKMLSTPPANLDEMLRQRDEALR